jgi:hypothetical protein
VKPCSYVSYSPGAITILVWFLSLSSFLPTLAFWGLAASFTPGIWPVLLIRGPWPRVTAATPGSVWESAGFSVQEAEGKVKEKTEGRRGMGRDRALPWSLLPVHPQASSLLAFKYKGVVHWSQNKSTLLWQHSSLFKCRRKCLSEY